MQQKFNLARRATICKCFVATVKRLTRKEDNQPSVKVRNQQLAR